MFGPRWATRGLKLRFSSLNWGFPSEIEVFHLKLRSCAVRPRVWGTTGGGRGGDFSRAEWSREAASSPPLSREAASHLLWLLICCFSRPPLIMPPMWLRRWRRWTGRWTTTRRTRPARAGSGERGGGAWWRRSYRFVKSSSGHRDYQQTRATDTNLFWKQS